MCVCFCCTYFVFFDYLICVFCSILWFFFFFKQKTAYEMRISDWSSDVCSSDLMREEREKRANTGSRTARFNGPGGIGLRNKNEVSPMGRANPAAPDRKSVV